jgi:predicted ATP-dependent serine protease
VFTGRATECQQIDHLLQRVRAGESAALVIRGEAGIGKTALLEYCAREASGCHLLHVTGVQSELELPFAGVHQLCAPMFKHISALPEPQKQALQHT